MRIAVACNEAMEVLESFAQTSEFAVFEISDDERLNGLRMVPSNGDDPAGQLAGEEVTHLLCGSIEAQTSASFAARGIEVVPGSSGDAIEAAGAFLMGRIPGK
ncbi:MAG: NifB/NifX family molybdenum-iron cluster-binding protein [Victivallaceae bacterium]|nr:NifB/NifX family molybdenum-iron cluster-binding protein [Victivallaceae bacterium]